ncbi:hypothetical protein COD11_21155 [Bacillus sp. AFS040349]|nr:hypothetical protein COD11_21155 [Bacillus sp. AFS040349]
MSLLIHDQIFQWSRRTLKNGVAAGYLHLRLEVGDVFPTSLVEAIGVPLKGRTDIPRGTC